MHLQAQNYEKIICMIWMAYGPRQQNTSAENAYLPFQELNNYLQLYQLWTIILLLCLYLRSYVKLMFMCQQADCPAAPETTTLTTNDIVINKLTQILSYLRQGRRDKKKKKEKGMSMCSKTLVNSNLLMKCDVSRWHWPLTVNRELCGLNIE